MKLTKFPKTFQILKILNMMIKKINKYKKKKKKIIIITLRMILKVLITSKKQQNLSRYRKL